MLSYQPADPMMSNVSYQRFFEPRQNQNPQNQPQPNMLTPGVTIVNQRPITNSRFPISYVPTLVLALSILKIIIGFLQIVIGIVDAVQLPDYLTSHIAFPLWCRVLFIVNGVIGCLTFKWPTKCMIGSFLGLSIASLILSMSMLSIIPRVLSYVARYEYYSTNSYFRVSSFVLLFLIFLELSLSIAAVVFSCRAFSKCCNTCNTNDCCSCVGCGECNQETDPMAQGYPMNSLNAPNAYQQRQPLTSATLQSQPNHPSSLINSFPGISHAINAASISNSATEDPNTLQITIQGNNSNQQANVPPEEAASAPVASQPAGAAAQIHMPQDNFLGPREQKQAPPSYSLQ